MQHNFVFQLTFYPFQDKINKLPSIICNLDTIQIHSRHGCHSDTYSDSSSDMVQIRSRHECHPDTHSDSAFRYSSDTRQIRMPSCSDMLQIRKSFCYSFRSLIQIQYGYTPDTDAIPLLI